MSEPEERRDRAPSPVARDAPSADLEVGSAEAAERTADGRAAEAGATPAARDPEKADPEKADPEKADSADGGARVGDPAGAPIRQRVGAPGRRATIMAVLAAILVLATGVAVWSALEASRLRDPGGNVALVDEAGTREVADQVSAGLKAIFSYDYNNLERTERAADRVLVEQAVGQYADSFAAATAQARAQRLVRTTTVRSVGVRELADDEARVLALVDQQTLHTAEGNRQETTSAALAVVAKRVGGEWKIAALAGL